MGTERPAVAAMDYDTLLPLSPITWLSERDTGTKKDMLAVSFSSFVKQEKRGPLDKMTW